MKPFKSLVYKLIALTLCLNYAVKSYGQTTSVDTNSTAEVKSLNKIRLNLLGIGYEREQKIGRITSFYIGAGAEASLIYEQTATLEEEYRGDGTYNYKINSDRTTTFEVYPSINTGIRHYYNFNRRIKKGKSTKNNAAGYVAFDVMAFFATQKSAVDYQINLGPMWGFQTNVGKRTNFELCLGPGVAITNQETFYGIGGKIGFSFLL